MTWLLPRAAVTLTAALVINALACNLTQALGRLS